MAGMDELVPRPRDEVRALLVVSTIAAATGYLISIAAAPPTLEGSALTGALLGVAAALSVDVSTGSRARARADNRTTGQPLDGGDERAGHQSDDHPR